MSLNCTARTNVPFIIIRPSFFKYPFQGLPWQCQSLCGRPQLTAGTKFLCISQLICTVAVLACGFVTVAQFLGQLSKCNQQRSAVTLNFRRIISKQQTPLKWRTFTVLPVGISPIQFQISIFLFFISKIVTKGVELRP